MATTLPKPYSPQQNPSAYTTPPNSHGQSQYTAVQQQRQYSPVASTPQTPTQHSPSSPHPLPQQATTEYPSLPLTKRGAPPQSPDPNGKRYLPAALRPTDPPPRSQPLTPPRSTHGSSDSLHKHPRALSRPSSRRSNLPPSSKQDLLASDLPSYIPQSDIELALTSTSDLPSITGPPTRAGWKPDAHAPICDYGTCSKSFGLFERRHHCRKCGNVFCREHSVDVVPLDQRADYHPLGERARSCAFCKDLWTEWVKERARALKEGETGRGRQDEERTDPMGVDSGKSKDCNEGKGGFVAGSIGVTGDWSTF